MFSDLSLKSALPLILLGTLALSIRFVSRYPWGQRLRSALIGPKERSASTTSTQINTLEREREYWKDAWRRCNESNGKLVLEVQKLNKAIIKRNRTIAGLRKGRKNEENSHLAGKV